MHILRHLPHRLTLAFFMQGYLPHSATSAVALFISSALLGGCASAGPPLTPTGTTQQSAVQSSANTSAVTATSLDAHGTLSGKILAASNVTVKTTTCIGGPLWSHDVNFTARGKSTGPYPGGFVAKGSWKGAGTKFGAHWDFYETFTIASKKRTIPGTIQGYGRFTFRVGCKAFGPVWGHLTYTSGSWSGPVTIPREIRNGFLEEKLH